MTVQKKTFGLSSKKSYLKMTSYYSIIIYDWYHILIIVYDWYVWRCCNNHNSNEVEPEFSEVRKYGTGLQGACHIIWFWFCSSGFVSECWDISHNFSMNDIKAMKQTWKAIASEWGNLWCSRIPHQHRNLENTALLLQPSVSRRPLWPDSHVFWRLNMPNKLILSHSLSYINWWCTLMKGIIKAVAGLTMML